MIRTSIRNFLNSTSLSLNKSSIYVLSIPITTYKSYIYCNHNQSILDESQRQTISSLSRLETKLVGLAAKGWNKMESSDLSVNKKIIELIKRLLNTIPYEENCLKLFPSKSEMIREINEETLKESPGSLSSKLIHSEVAKQNLTINQLEPIPVYHPSFQSPTTILTQLHLFRDNSRAKHIKYAGMCAIGVPLSLPFALIPVIPNVPGLYLTYRLYCNIKALIGVKHLDYLLETSSKNNPGRTDTKAAVQDTNHLSFKVVNEIDSIYKTGNTSKELECNSIQEEERVIITKEIIDNLCQKLDLSHLKDDLLKALNQETSTLNKSMKLNNEVE